jgi:cellulose synthase/poly-beta-1,6-N-acetylglucosamine synthase-like glycosyltransferase
LKWVIVDDGSTDNTREIVGRYLAQNPWMELVQMPQRRDRSFAAKVVAFNAGFEKVKDLPYDVVGNLDGDTSLDRDHFEFLIGKFAEDPTLGVAGEKRVTTRRQTVLKDTSTCRGNANCSVDNVGKILGGTFRIALAELIGWP